MLLEAETIVVGGGPAGLLASLHLEGDTLLFESRPRVGRPPHCAGVVSVDTLKRLPRDALAEYYDGLFLAVGSATTLLHVRLARVNRPLLEDVLLSMVREKGVSVRLSCRVDRIEEHGPRYEVRTTCGRLRARNVIIAEGAGARLSSQLGFAKPAVIYAYQVVKRLRRRARIEPYAPLAALLGGRVKYTWIIPMEYGSVIAVGAAGEATSVRQLVNNVMRVLESEGYEGEIVEVRSGLIPYTLPLRKPWKRSRESWVMVMGDAAGLAKASSGGGLYAISRTSIIPRFLEKGDFQKAWRIYRSVYERLTKLYVAAKLLYSSSTIVKLVSRIVKALLSKGEPLILDYDEVVIGGWVSRYCVKSRERCSERMLHSVYGSVLKSLAI